MNRADVRDYQVEARSTDTFGRVLVSSRDQHLVVDGPVQNGCPGEAINPAELFLSGVAACGVERVQVLVHALPQRAEFEIQFPRVEGLYPDDPQQDHRGLGQRSVANPSARPHPAPRCKPRA